MIRSGYQLDFEAHLVTGWARALPPLVLIQLRFFDKASVSFAAAAASLAAIGRMGVPARQAGAHLEAATRAGRLARRR